MAEYRTMPDYGVSVGQLAGPDIDAGEQAARVGSVSLYRRGGRVVWWDDGAHLGPFVFNNAAVTALTTYLGSSSIQTTPGGVGLTGYIYKYIPADYARVYGFEFTFAVDQQDYIDVTVIRDGPTNRDVLAVRLDFILNIITVGWPAGAGPLAGVFYNSLYPHWHNFKLIVDMSINTDTYMFIDDARKNSGVRLTTVAGGTGEGLMFGITHTQNGAPSSSWIDNILITVDEPPHL